ncbi:type I glyceraldehyde-3-phosphate dehydrogenase [Desulfovermiculus halophilus]|jgi:glyceraldehyde 3-phosphate dehydrogenase|uniref:type I glyceraldehyde-3-phosphate dehydrogenase n=1 Tax=Desulfovermiculus halophilus TaxID=339722 RepID=UPI0004807F9A|nr:type I glyceraldehyde-3-phosphate dehydrogenase [Desulfovermiculus halophilus]
MSKLTIGINGFGRIGRQVLKALRTKYADSVQVVAVNDLFDAAENANLLKHDSTYGRFSEPVSVDGNVIHLGDWEIQNFAYTDPKRIPWEDLGVDLVIESTGIFRTGPQAAAHLEAGAKKVIITAPAKEVDRTIVLGVNGQEYSPQTDRIISNASCTTNCLAPVAWVIHRAFTIRIGSMCTVHAYTNDQRILDLPHKDPRRARAAGQNIIPTTTGAAKLVGQVIPDLAGKIDGYAMRVPVPTVSVVDFTAQVEKNTSTEELHRTLEQAAEGELKGILGYSREPLVSSDFILDPHSSIVDPEFTSVREGNWVKVMAWYDNEWGYSCRVADLADMIREKG